MLRKQLSVKSYTIKGEAFAVALFRASVSVCPNQLDSWLDDRSKAESVSGLNRTATNKNLETGRTSRHAEAQNTELRPGVDR